MDNYLSLVPPIGASGDLGPAPQPPSPTFGAVSPTVSLMSIADDGAREGDKNIGALSMMLCVHLKLQP